MTKIFVGSIWQITEPYSDRVSDLVAGDQLKVESRAFHPEKFRRPDYLELQVSLVGATDGRIFKVPKHLFNTAIKIKETENLHRYAALDTATGMFFAGQKTLYGSSAWNYPTINTAYMTSKFRSAYKAQTWQTIVYDLVKLMPALVKDNSYVRYSASGVVNFPPTMRVVKLNRITGEIVETLPREVILEERRRSEVFVTFEYDLASFYMDLNEGNPVDEYPFILEFFDPTYRLEDRHQEFILSRLKDFPRSSYRFRMGGQSLWVAVTGPEIPTLMKLYLPDEVTMTINRIETLNAVRLRNEDEPC